MTAKLNKPILLSGLGITAILALWHGMDTELLRVGEWGLLGAIALGSVFSLLRPGKAKIDFHRPITLTRAEVDKTIATAGKILTEIAPEVPADKIEALQKQLATLPEILNRSNLEVAITGIRKTGKTLLKGALETQYPEINFIETEPLLTTFEEREKAAIDAALQADAVIYLINGDLTDSEWAIIRQLTKNHQRVILALNKADMYPADEIEQILQNITAQVKPIIAAEDIVAIAPAPNPVKVRQHQDDGTIKEWMEAQTPFFNALPNLVKGLIETDKSQLLLASLWRAAEKIKVEGKTLLNEVRRQKAMPLIEQYQWIAGAAAFANPVAALDLVATAAVNGQMILDVGAIYGQKLTLSQAQTIGTTLGKLMVQLGLVELSSQTIGAVLKSHAATYIAGGAVQGISAAYLTRLAGLSLIEYWQDLDVTVAPEAFSLESLGAKLKAIFEQNQRITFLQDFVKQAGAQLNRDKVTV